VVFLLVVGASTWGCTSIASTPTQSPPTPLLLTSTPSPTSTVEATTTAARGPETPTAAPLPGTTSTQVNVRAQPSSSSPTLAVLAPATTVQITGKDAGGNWYRILYPQAKDGLAWVTAQYIEVQNRDGIPVVGSSSVQGIGGTITEQVKIRSGPGVNFDALGTLNARDAVNIVGRDSSSAWLQITYADGKGWISAPYVQAAGTENLPIVTSSGEVLGTGTPAPTSPSPTATVSMARDDHDSESAPAATIAFSPSGVRTLIYSSDLSTPDGDAADWIAFTPYKDTVTIRLECTGNADVTGEVRQGGQRISMPKSIDCGASFSFNVNPGQAYLLRLAPVPQDDQLQYTTYTLTITD
jgi:uncharacterized protein YraI